MNVAVTSCFGPLSLETRKVGSILNLMLDDDLVMPVRGSHDAEEMLKEGLLDEYFSMIRRQQETTSLPRTLANPFNLAEHYSIYFLIQHSFAFDDDISGT